MLSQATITSQKKKMQRESQNQEIFTIDLWMRNFSKRPHISMENLFVEPKGECVTLSMTQLCSGVYL